MEENWNWAGSCACCCCCNCDACCCCCCCCLVMMMMRMGVSGAWERRSRTIGWRSHCMHAWDGEDDSGEYCGCIRRCC